MKVFKARRPSPALVISIAALVLAAGGTAYAAGYVINSIHQISPKVVNKLKGNRGPRGFTGPQGQRGIQGTQGIQGIQGNTGATGPANVVIRWGAAVTVPHTGPIVRDAYAACNANERLVGGGANSSGNSSIWNTYIVASNPSDGTLGGVPADGSQTTGGQWHVEANNQSGAGGNDVTMRAYALCAS